MGDVISYESLLDLIKTLQETERQLILVSRGRSYGFNAAAAADVEEFWTHETIEGYRMWNLAGNGGTLLVGSNGHPWRKSKMEARHQPKAKSGVGAHPAPHWGCNCGINAAKTYEDLTRAFHLDTDSIHKRGRVTGIVDLYGVVHEYERGYRASHAKIRELTLWVRNTQYWEEKKLYSRVDVRENAIYLKETLARHYKVPVELQLV